MTSEEDVCDPSPLCAQREPTSLSTVNYLSVLLVNTTKRTISYHRIMCKLLKDFHVCCITSTESIFRLDRVREAHRELKGIAFCRRQGSRRIVQVAVKRSHT